MSTRIIKKVDFEIETATGYETETVKITKMKFDAFHDVLGIVNELYEIISKDEALSVLFEELFADDSLDPSDEALQNFTEEELAEIKADNKKAAERRFYKGLMGAFPLLVVHLPKQATDLLVALSGVDRKKLGQQDLETVLEVYDAVLEANQIDVLLERIKKSFDATKSTVAFLNKRRKATQLQ